MKIKILLYNIVLTVVLTVSVWGQNTYTVELSQIHFPISQSTNKPLDILIVKDMSNSVVSVSMLPTQIINKLTVACQSVLPSVSIRDVPARDFWGSFVELPFLEVEGSLGLGTLRSISPENPTNSPWVIALPFTNCVIRASEVTNIYFIEIIDRLAQFMDMDVGIMSSGGIIYGYAGNWPTNYIPAYTFTLGIRFGE